MQIHLKREKNVKYKNVSDFNISSKIDCFSKEHGSLVHHIARTLTDRRICLGNSIYSILI